MKTTNNKGGASEELIAGLITGILLATAVCILIFIVAPSGYYAALNHSVVYDNIAYLLQVHTESRSRLTTSEIQFLMSELEKNVYSGNRNINIRVGKGQE